MINGFIGHLSVLRRNQSKFLTSKLLHFNSTLMLMQICSSSQSTHINTHTQQYTWLALSPAFLPVFPLSFPDLILSHKLMSKESAAGHNTEGKLPCFSQCIAVTGADLSSPWCCRLVYFSVSPLQ